MESSVLLADGYDIESVIFLLKVYCNVVEELACFNDSLLRAWVCILIKSCFLCFIFVDSSQLEGFRLWCYI